MRGRYLVRSLKAVAFLRLVDAVTGLIAPRRPSPKAPETPARILVCNWAHLGDVLLVLPALRTLREMFPHARIDLLIGSWAVAVVEGTGLYDELHLVDHVLLNRAKIGRIEKLRRYLAGRRAFLHACSARNYDVAINLYFYFPSAIPLLWRAGIPIRAGFTSAGYGALLTHAVEWVFRDRPIVAFPADIIDRLWPTRHMAIDGLHPCYPGYPRPCQDEGQNSVPTPYVLVHTGAGKVWKEWPEENWLAVIQGLREEAATLVLSGVGVREKDRARRLAAAHDRAVLFIDRPWSEFVSVTAAASCVICVDSSATHIAAAFRVPTVVIYPGTNDVALWGPPNPNARVLTAPTGCAPCHRSGCAAMACLRDVTPRDVLTQVKDLLAAAPGSIRLSPA
jgi:ADP-heptose:LPS heptosyltransferase